MKTKTRLDKRPRRGAKLGQHFLTNAHIAHVVAESAGVAPGVDVLEIGPGTGALTKEILKLGGIVTAIEKDSALVARLRETFAEEIRNNTFRLIEGDVRDCDPQALFSGAYVLAANIPYYITGEIIRRFLTASHQPTQMALLIQKEVAQRIVARDGKESILSLSVKAYGTPKLVRTVSAGNFNPPPSVDSAILQVSGISRSYFTDINESRFFEVVKAGFAAKRKKLAGNLRAVMKNPDDALASCGIVPNARAEDLTLAEWQTLARQ